MDNQTKRPIALIIGADGNVFNLISICSKSLRKAGLSEEASKMTEEVMNSGSYDEALQIMNKYCELK